MDLELKATWVFYEAWKCAVLFILLCSSNFSCELDGSTAAASPGRAILPAEKLGNLQRELSLAEGETDTKQLFELKSQLLNFYISFIA